eukprot:TRINITY_DN21773_c0_g2_i2.p1 TRINITY_DN21773_c0_g2~~TRINITY_DN21773_c0_g2_i2.p1  ORF type:complete len:113 (-),score=22.74 TRINITY_DN21773_c0_g2_i2:21-359(-)
MIRRPPRSTLSSSSAASDVYKRQAVRKRNTIHATHICVCVSTTLDYYSPLPTAIQFASECCGVRTPTNLSLIHISEPTRLLSISYAVFCLKKKKKTGKDKKIESCRAGNVKS